MHKVKKDKKWWKAMNPQSPGVIESFCLAGASLSKREPLRCFKGSVGPLWIAAVSVPPLRAPGWRPGVTPAHGEEGSLPSVYHSSQQSATTHPYPPTHLSISPAADLHDVSSYLIPSDHRERHVPLRECVGLRSWRNVRVLFSSRGV